MRRSDQTGAGASWERPVTALAGMSAILGVYGSSIAPLMHLDPRTGLGIGAALGAITGVPVMLMLLRASWASVVLTLGACAASVALIGWWQPFLAMVLAPGVAMLVAATRARPAVLDRAWYLCPRCDTDLRGNATEICHQCGTAIPEPTRERLCGQ